MNKLKKGDEVIVITGKDKNRRGKIIKIAGDRITVEGLNIVKKCIKSNPRTNTQGEVVDKEAPIHRSNVALYNYVTNKAGKVGIKMIQEEDSQEGRLVRYFKENNELIDI